MRMGCSPSWACAGASANQKPAMNEAIRPTRLPVAFSIGSPSDRDAHATHARAREQQSEPRAGMDKPDMQAWCVTLSKFERILLLRDVSWQLVIALKDIGMKRNGEASLRASCSVSESNHLVARKLSDHSGDGRKRSGRSRDRDPA